MRLGVDSGVAVRVLVGVVVGPGVGIDVAVAVGSGASVDVGLGCDSVAVGPKVAEGVEESEHAASRAMAARHTRLRQYPRRRAGGGKTPPKRRVAVISHPLYRSLKSGRAPGFCLETSSGIYTGDCTAGRPSTRRTDCPLSWEVLNSTTLTSVKDSGVHICPLRSQFHLAAAKRPLSTLTRSRTSEPSRATV